MKKLVGSSVSLALLLTSACTPILKEVRYTGGYPGHLLDKRTFDASGSKKLTLLRATIILAMAADMGRTTVSGQDGDSFAQLLASATKEINYAAADIYKASDDPCVANDEDAADDKDCVGFYENFETNLPRIESRIIKVMIAALPTDKARKFLTDITKGDVLGAAWSALGAAAATAGGLHVAFARYRSGLEIVAGGVENCHGGDDFDASEQTVVHAAKCLGLSDKDLFENPNELKREELGNVKISPRAFYMLLRGVAADCVSLDFAGKGEELTTSQTLRATACNSIGFAPTARPFRFDGNKDAVERVSQGSAPADENGALPSPTPTPTPTPAPTAAPIVPAPPTPAPTSTPAAVAP